VVVACGGVGDELDFEDGAVVCLLLVDFGVVGFAEVDVGEALVGVGFVVPFYLEEFFDLLGEAYAGAAVGGEEDARDAEAAGEFGGFFEEDVLLHAETADLEGEVVGDDDYFAAVWILGCLKGHLPSDHAYLMDH